MQRTNYEQRGRITLAMIAALLTLTACQSTNTGSPIDQVSTHDGLTKADVKGVDAVYRKPGFDLSQYNKVLLRPVEVAFSKHFQPEKESMLYNMNKVDREKIKSELAELFHETFKKVLDEQGGYVLVDEPAKDVLEIRAAIINLYITAPDISMQTAGRVRTYAASAGEMTLVAESHDSVTGELLSRAYDRREDSNSGTWQFSDSMWNASEARREIKRWCELLKKSLDASRGKVT